MIPEAENPIWILPAQYTLPEVLAERITEAILSGVLKPGARIIESQLARELGISRGPLREALKTLEVNGLIEYRKGRGTNVRTFPIRISSPWSRYGRALKDSPPAMLYVRTIPKV